MLTSSQMGTTLKVESSEHFFCWRLASRKYTSEKGNVDLPSRGDLPLPKKILSPVRFEWAINNKEPSHHLEWMSYILLSCKGGCTDITIFTHYNERLSSPMPRESRRRIEIPFMHKLGRRDCTLPSHTCRLVLRLFY